MKKTTRSKGRIPNVIQLHRELHYHSGVIGLEL